MKLSHELISRIIEVAETTPQTFFVNKSTADICRDEVDPLHNIATDMDVDYMQMTIEELIEVRKLKLTN